MAKRLVKDKISRLEQIYDLFDRTMDPFDLCCRVGCADCCTCNVTMTGIEGRKLMQIAAVDKEKKMALKRAFCHDWGKRYQPKLTTNRFARYCIEGRHIPEEENDPGWGKCPLLKSDRCSFYSGRPFGCRAMVSQTSCKNEGAAVVPPMVQTYQNIFLQAIEQLDQGGIFGNMIDVILYISEKRQGSGDETASNLLINEPIKVLMVPPEHRAGASKVIEKLSAILG